jgi:S-adenosylmethionine/arginine decarboxylase-like enzyme
MTEEIINRVANSKLATIDLEDFYPQGNRVVIDIKDWLFQELILKEKDFREHVQNHNWEQYQNTYVALTCSSDVIVPSWAFLLLSSNLSGFAKKIVVGNLELLESVIFENIISNLDVSLYQDKPVIIKGCSKKPIPASAYTLLIQKIQPIAKSILFGEACSTVPLYKAKK